jgi:hypothetical protein
VINSPNEEYVGLFGAVGPGGVVRNLALRNATITGQDYVGALVGRCELATIVNCSATGVVSGTYGVGGLVGSGSYSEIVDSHADCSVTSRYYYAGGLAGTIDTVVNSYATGPVTCVRYAGGLAGSVDTATGSFATGAVFAGENAGGFAGRAYAAADCFASGPVIGKSIVGGFAGLLEEAGTLERCYAAGPVSGMRAVGGLVGFDEDGTATDCYWDVETTGQTTSALGTPLSTAEMQQQATFAGWDFADTWEMVESVTYPYLQTGPVPFGLSLQLAGPGTVTLSPPPAPDGTYAPGTLVTLTANWDPASAVLHEWSGATPAGPATATVVMDTHRSAAVTFYDYVEIATLNELASIGENAAFPSSNVHYALTADIDASETATWWDGAGFAPRDLHAAVFDGNGHTITGLHINRPSESDVGLFGAVSGRSEIRDVGLVGGSVIGNYATGQLVGYLDTGSISNCFASGDVNGYGGLVGILYYASALDCFATGDVEGKGGLAGDAYDSDFLRCYAHGTVRGSGTMGGLVGSMRYRGSLEACFASGAVSGTQVHIGGLVGSAVADISDCFATGPVSGDSRIGGLVGELDPNGAVTHSFACGMLTSRADGGGLIGVGDPNVVSDSYWDVQATGIATSAGGAGRSTAELKQQGTFVGWDFADTWGVQEQDTYPYLQLAGPPLHFGLQTTGPGAVTVDPPPAADGTFPAGTLVTLTATWDPEQARLYAWEGATATGPATAIVLMDTHKSVHVSFVKQIQIDSLADLLMIGQDPAYPAERRVLRPHRGH